MVRNHVVPIHARCKFFGQMILCVLLTSCGATHTVLDKLKNPQKPTLLNVPITPIYLMTNNSYLKADGRCQGYQVIEFTYSSSLTPTNTVFGRCTNDIILANLPVLHGTQNQLFSVKIVGYLATPQSTLPLPPNLSVLYTPPTTAVSGFAVVSGGGTLSGGAYLITNSSIGDVTTGTQTGTGIKSRNGIHGNLDP